jgi:hypothetical protein
MPSPGQPADDDSTAWQRFTARLSLFMLKPAPVDDDEGSGDKGSNGKRSKDDAGPTTIPEIEAAIKRADDKERLIGLLAAPIAAAIALIVVSALIAHDPKAIVDGHVNKLHASTSLYAELGVVTLLLALAILVTAWFRKRTFLGIAMALYGLAIFNLHYWGFGLPFIVAAAWYLVRAYRLSEKLKLAKAGLGGGSLSGSVAPPPKPSKRYTPPAAPSRGTPKPKPGKELEAG